MKLTFVSLVTIACLHSVLALPTLPTVYLDRRGGGRDQGPQAAPASGTGRTGASSTSSKLSVYVPQSGPPRSASVPSERSAGTAGLKSSTNSKSLLGPAGPGDTQSTTRSRSSIRSSDSVPSVPQSGPPSISPSDSVSSRGSQRNTQFDGSSTRSSSSSTLIDTNRNSSSRGGTSSTGYTITIHYPPPTVVAQNFYLVHGPSPLNLNRPFYPPGPRPLVPSPLNPNRPFYPPVPGPPSTNLDPAFHLIHQPGFPQPQFVHGNQNPAFHLGPQPVQNPPFYPPNMRN